MEVTLIEKRQKKKVSRKKIIIEIRKHNIKKIKMRKQKILKMRNEDVMTRLNS